MQDNAALLNVLLPDGLKTRNVAGHRVKFAWKGEAIDEET